MKTKIAVILAGLAFLACTETPVDPVDTTSTTTVATTTPHFSSVTIGMTRAQVVALMGSPNDDSTMTIGSSIYETLTWSRWSEYSYDWIYYYTVDFVDGIVTSKFSG